MKGGRRGREREKERPPLTPFSTSGRRKRPPFFPSFARGRIMYLDPRSSQSSRSPPSPPLSLAPPLLILRLVLRSAREARVLPVPIVSCMINDRVDLSPSPAAYASFRALDGSIDREGGAAKLTENAGAYLAWLKGNLKGRDKNGNN